MKPFGKTLMLGGVAASLLACGDEPTAVNRPTITLPAEQLAALNGAFDDALNRLVPALADQSAAGAVRQALSAGTIGLAARDAGQLERALGTAVAALPEQPDSGDAPIRATLRLVIDQVSAAAREKE